MTTFRLPPRKLCVLALALGTSAGCANSQQFTAGRLPYGGGDVAAASPRDPFLTPGVAESRPASQVAEAASRSSYPQTAVQGMPGDPSLLTHTAALPYRDDNPFQQPAPVHNTHQAAYVPAESDDPFAVTPAGMSPSPQASSSVEQMSFEMPVGMPASNPFAEVQGQVSAIPYQAPMPQIVPMNGATDAWQPSVTTSSVQADEFLPPR